MGGARELSYEEIVREVSAAIGREDSVRTVRAEVNAAITGKTASYVVDVYWEFTDGDVVYKTVIQARDWDKAAGNRELFRFLSLLRDIPGQTTGVWFTRPVYEADTKRLAEDAGIILYELRSGDGQTAELVAGNVDVEVDADWVRAEKERLGMGGESVRVSGAPRELFLYDGKGDCFDSLDGIINDYVRRGLDGGTERARVRHEFAGPVFMRIGHEAFPLVKLRAVAFELELVDPAALNGREIVGYILEKVIRYYSPSAARR